MDNDGEVSATVNADRSIEWPFRIIRHATVYADRRSTSYYADYTFYLSVSSLHQKILVVLHRFRIISPFSPFASSRL